MLGFSIILRRDVVGSIDDTDTSFDLSSVVDLPATPFGCELRSGAGTETGVTVTGIAGDTLTVTRGGSPVDHGAGAQLYRRFVYEWPDDDGQLGTGGASGDLVSVNGSHITDPNFNDSTPSAPSGSVNVNFQESSGDVSAYIDGDDVISTFLPGAEQAPTIRTSPIFSVSATTVQLTSQTCHALYIGKASRANPTCSIKYVFIGTGCSGVTWFEVAIATGAPVYGGPSLLTTRGYGDASGSITAGTFYGVSFSTSGIAYGDDIWILAAYNATGRGTFAASGADRGHGLYASVATTRPSAMSANTSFAANSSQAVGQWMLTES